MRKNNKSGLDLLKVGVFLLGVSAIVVSSIALHFYLKVFSKEVPYSQPDFYARCQDKMIIIDANRDLTDVEVLDNQSTIVCEFPKINADSDELCSVNVSGIYQVRHRDSKRIIDCREMIIEYPQKVVD